MSGVWCGSGCLAGNQAIWEGCLPVQERIVLAVGWPVLGDGQARRGKNFALVLVGPAVTM